MFCGFYRARSSRRNSPEVAVSNAASPHSINAKTARVRMEETLTPTPMSAKHTTATTNLGTLTLPSSRSLKACAKRDSQIENTAMGRYLLPSLGLERPMMVTKAEARPTATPLHPKPSADRLSLYRRTAQNP